MEIFYLLNGTKVDRLPYSNGSDSSLTPALVSTRDTVSVSIKYSVVLCLEVRVDQDTTLAHLPGPHCGLTVH